MVQNRSSEDGSAQDLAARCAKAMWEEDRASSGLGMEILHVAPGVADLAMTVRGDMVNGHNICHGGFIFTLADSAFAYACNSYNQSTVAASCEISFMKPGRLGDRLTAKAREIYREGRNGVYDIEVTTQEGAVIALFRGKSRSIAGTIVEESN